MRFGKSSFGLGFGRSLSFGGALDIIPVEPVAVPVNSAASEVTGAGVVGSPHTATIGTWDAYDELQRRWTRNGVAIGNTTGSYTPVDDDDETTLGHETRTRNTGGAWSAWVASNGVAVTYAAPTATGSLDDVAATVGGGDATRDAGSLFTGAVGGVWAVTVNGAVNAAVAVISGVGVVTVFDNVAITGATIVASYTNSGGTASRAFSATVEEVVVAEPAVVSGFDYDEEANEIGLTVSKAGTLYYMVNASATALAGAVIAAHSGATVFGSAVIGVGETIITPDMSTLTDGTYYMHVTVLSDGLYSVDAVEAFSWVVPVVAVDTFSMGVAGPYFPDAVPPANTTRVEVEFKFRNPTPYALTGSVGQIFSQSSTGCDFGFTIASGSAVWRLNAEDGAGTNVVSGPNVGPILAPYGTWIEGSLDVDLTAAGALLYLDGSLAHTWTYSPAPAVDRRYFQTVRAFNFLSQSGGTNFLPAGMEIEYVRAYRTTGGVRTLIKEISGLAAVVNALPGKTGSDAT